MHLINLNSMNGKLIHNNAQERVEIRTKLKFIDFQKLTTAHKMQIKNIWGRIQRIKTK